MNIVRKEIRTGALVVFALASIVGILIYLGAPGVFAPQQSFGIFFDNAAGIDLGTPVMLAGRKVGQVTAIKSPVPKAGRPKGMPEAEALIEVKIDKKAEIYNVCKVQLASYSFLGNPVIDFTDGDETSGRAEEWTYFEGQRAGGLADATGQIVAKIDPAITQLISALKSLESTANNVTIMTNEGGDLSQALTEIRQIAANLKTMTGEEGVMHKTLANVEALTRKDGTIDQAVIKFQALIGPESDMAKALADIHRITDQVSKNNDVPATLKNFREASLNLNSAIAQLKKQFTAVGGNLEQASETVKKQPWRLIWPSTKKYPEEKVRKPEAKKKTRR